MQNIKHLKHYYAVLINNQQCQFDNASFNSMSKLKDWAKGRGSQEYKCKVYTNDDNDNYDVYQIKNNRMTLIKQ